MTGGLGPGKGLRTGQSPWATHSKLRRDVLRVLCGRRVQCDRCVTAILPGSKWSCLPLRIVLQEALSEVTPFYPSLKLRDFVDDISVLLKGRNKELVETAELF